MKIHHIAISVKDLDRSVKFYKDNFGFEEFNRFTKLEWDGEAVVLKLEDLLLEIFHFKSFVEKLDDTTNLKVIGLKHIGIQVKDANDTYKKLKDMGLDIDMPAKGVTSAWYCFLRDPDGIPIEIYQPK